MSQSVNGEVLIFTWDLASPLARVLATSDGVLDLYSLARIGEEQDGEWVFYLPNELGSIRQATDGNGAVTSSRKWTPFGVEVGTAQAG
jgi:hypothetical protein